MRLTGWFSVFLAAAPFAVADPTGIELSADARGAGKPLVHYWSAVVGGGRANEGLRASWLEALHTVASECGFHAVRLEGLFHDDMAVYREDHGRPKYNFQYLDDVFDRMLALDVHPFVNLGFPPAAMASTANRVFWWGAHAAPPKDDARWGELVAQWARHCEERYGAPEVRSWRFEVWSEPDRRTFFDGDENRYFALYRATAAALKSVDAELKVGGPASSPAAMSWVGDLLAYARDRRLPVDFVSFHPFPQPGDPADSTHAALIRLKALVAASAFPSAEIQVTRWNSSASARDFAHDGIPGGALVLKNVLECRGLADSLAYWTFTDATEEEGPGDAPFDGGCGLVNYQGIVKPAFHAYRYLNALGDEELQAVPGGIVTRRKSSGRVVLLAYNFPPEQSAALPVCATLAEADRLAASGSARELSIALTGLRPGGQILIESVDRDHANALAAWEEMGRPGELSRPAIDTLRSAARDVTIEYRQADDAGHFILARPLGPWAMLLLREI